MSASYRHLALAQVRPGMILSDVLLDKQGQVLLPEGAVLSEATIALLPRHGIAMLAVRCDDGGAGAAPAIDVAGVEQRLAHLFRKHELNNDDDWAGAILRRYVTDYRLGREIEE